MSFCTFQLSLGPGREAWLTANCNGKRRAINLTPYIDIVLQRVAEYHRALHGGDVVGIDFGNILRSAIASVRQMGQNKLAAEMVEDMAPILASTVPGGSLAMETLVKIDSVVSKAKEGNPVARDAVKAVKLRSDLGDPKAREAVLTMAVVSKAQNIKAAKEESFYQRGLSVGHDPWGFVGASLLVGQKVRDQRGGAGGGGGVTVTPGASRPTGGSTKPRDASKGPVVTDHRGGKTTTYYTPPSKGRSPFTDFARTPALPPVRVIHPTGAPIKTSPLPTTSSVPGTPQDPYAQQPEYPGYPGYPYPDPGYPGYPYPGYPYPDPGYPYPGYPYPDPFGYGYPYPDPFAYGYPLPGLPPGYGYEEPIVDQGGFQVYDPATDSFYSSSQKMIYDESTGMFYPENPYSGYPYSGF